MDIDPQKGLSFFLHEFFRESDRKHPKKSNYR
jgi:hypothetical protein